MLIGITGNIGAGKSLVADILADNEVKIIDTDLLAREVVTPGKPAWEEIIKTFGKQFVLPDGELNRKLLGEFIFKDSQKRDLLNRIVHPAVYRLLDQRLNQIYLAESSSRVLIGLVVPLLIETGYYSKVNQVLVVAAEKKLCLERIVVRDGISEEEAELRYNSQMPAQEKIGYADFVIYNNGSEHEVVLQVETFLAEISH